jgi:hypothetical protein
MKVRCIKLIDSRGNTLEKSPWLTLGKVYDVLTLTFGTQQKWLLRLVGDGLNGVALFPLDQFEIVSQKIPAPWIVTWNSKEIFEMTTETWSQPGYWERYYDRDPEALKVFDEEKAKITQDDP